MEKEFIFLEIERFELPRYFAEINSSQVGFDLATLGIKAKSTTTEPF
jgi:hypothetical protein